MIDQLHLDAVADDIEVAAEADHVVDVIEVGPEAEIVDEAETDHEVEIEAADEADAAEHEAAVDHEADPTPVTIDEIAHGATTTDLIEANHAID